MEITKKRLRQIINEEIVSLGALREDDAAHALATQLANMDPMEFEKLLQSVEQIRATKPSERA
tara:strand:- start:220 stop:408 length:189 start_codon:yes stop_codon:yes gene_type:complete